MKKFAISVVCFLASVVLSAQVPAGFSYQAVVRNTSGDIVANKAVKFRFSILTGTETGTSAYVETQSVTTNEFGLANLKVGMGTKISGTFDPDGWGGSKHYLKVELDPNNGNSFNVLGTSQLLSVPYAFHAKTVENETDGDPANEIQDLELSGTVLSLTKSTKTVTLPSSGGGDNWGTDYVRTDATLAGQGTTSAPLKIAQQSATSGQVLKWNGTIWSPANDEGGGGTLILPYSGSASFASDPVFSITNTGNGSGIKGKSNATSGVYYGLIGESMSEHGIGVYGSAPDTGVEGIAQSAGGTAVYGYAYDSQGTNYGIRGVTNSSNGYSGFFQGGRFYISGNTGIGTETPTAKLDVDGQVKIRGGSPGQGKVLTSDTGGLASWQTASGGFVLPYSGDYGGADAAFSINQSGTGNAIYVYNPAETGEVTSISVHNNSSSGTGIAAIMHSATGTATGISGFTASSAGTGVKGLANSGNGVNYGVKGESKSVEGVGVWGTNTSSTGITYGVQGSVSSLSGYSGYFLGGTFCVMSNVGIGSSTPSAKLEVAGQVKITGGSPGQGKVLTSDENGLASWATPASNPWQTSGSNIYFNTGNIGIGTASPAAKLDISANQGPNLIIRDSDGGSGRPGIQFSNNNIHYIGGDDGSEEVFGFYSGYGNNRTYAARLNVHGPAAGNWGYYIGFTHDGKHGRINTDNGYLILEPAGKSVGINTDDPTQILDVNGNARFRTIASDAYSGVLNRKSDGTLTTSTSDQRLKENINSLENSLDKVMQLKGISFTWRSNPEYGTRIGFIAQEFEKVIPELVFTNEVDGYKGINYAEISAVIVEAVKEQQRIIEHLKAENDRLKAENESTSKNLKKIREEADKLSARLLKVETLLGTTAEK
jgi:hypothetical protein